MTAEAQAIDLGAEALEIINGSGIGGFTRKRMNFKIMIEGDGSRPTYWPFWPFRLDRATILFERGFKVKIYQRDGRSYTLATEPVIVQGYTSTDGMTLTTSADFNGGTFLKRVTETEED